MASTNKSKKGRTKLSQGRPISSSVLSHPVVEDASHFTTLSSFSPSGKCFAFISLAVDKHRLRVYNTTTGQSLAEYNADSARISALTWARSDPSEGVDIPSNDPDTSPSKKKRKKRNSSSTEVSPGNGNEVVILGLSDGTVLIFSPAHGRVLHTLSDPTSTGQVLSVAVTESPEGVSSIWTSSADGTIRLWNARKNDTWKTDGRKPYASMAARPTDQDHVEMLVAHHGIQLLSTTAEITSIDAKRPTQLASFTGHATTIKALQWDASRIPSTRFLSLAEADRFLYIWEVSEESTEGKPAASIPLDSDARKFCLSIPQKSPSTTERQTLLTLSSSGKIMLFPIPRELSPPASSNRTQHKIPTLLPRSNVAFLPKDSVTVRVVDATFSVGDEGSIRIASIIGGVRPVFSVIRYLDTSGEFIKDIVIDDILEGPTTDPDIVAPTRRYVEHPSLAIGSGVELGLDKEMDRLAAQSIEGDLDVDLAELSLGQRLTALSGADIRLSAESDDEIEGHNSPKKTQNEVNIVPANSLTRTLIQALHSSDSRLLETCLAHSDQTLIRNTVRRLPPQLAVPLITACVERLGRGARAGNIKGGGGGASSQRGTGLITWVKTTLAVHSGHLMTIPDLVARLSGLHATLTSRLNLQESLLSLNGRLDLVLSQVEMRSSVAPAPLMPRKNAPNKLEREVTRYVEGESEGDSDEDDEMEVEVESGDEEGSVEDVELGGESDEDDEMSEDDEDDDSEGPTMNGFIDDEADEYSEEDDESE